jgi:hypothetical protein
MGFPVFRTTLLLLITGLILAGCSQDPTSHIEDIYSLQADPTEENLNRVRAQLDNPDGGVRATALHVLVTQPVEDGPELALRFLDDDHPFTRMTAAILLGDAEAEEAVPALGRRLVEDEDWHVRQRAAEALAKIGGDESAGLLKAGFTDPIKEVRRASIMGVSRLSPEDSLEGLQVLLQEDPEWEVRVQAARALAGLGMSEAVPALQAAIQDDPNEFVRAAAAHGVKVLEQE